MTFCTNFLVFLNFYRITLFKFHGCLFISEATLIFTSEINCSFIKICTFINVIDILINPIFQSSNKSPCNNKITFTFYSNRTTERLSTCNLFVFLHFILRHLNSFTIICLCYHLNEQAKPVSSYDEEVTQ